MSGVPSGWSANPSSRLQRAPVIVLALAGFGLTAYLALAPADERRTGAARGWPPATEAAAGALWFLLDAVTAAAGGTRRWRTTPWLVLASGLLIGPGGAALAAFAVSEWIASGGAGEAWLGAALAAVLMIGPAMDEVLASLQHVARTPRGRRWRAIRGAC